MSETLITAPIHANRVILTLAIIMTTAQAYAEDIGDKNIGDKNIGDKNIGDKNIGDRAPVGKPNPQPVPNAKAIPGEFRVEIQNTQIQPRNETLGKHLILFSGGTTYGFSLTPPLEITIIDNVNRSVALVSRERQVRCHISMDDLMGQTARVIADAKSTEIRERWGIDAVASVSPEGEHRIEFGGIEYLCMTRPAASKPAAVEFARFADWASRLNLVRKLGVPPFGRMKLNESVAAKSSLPKKIRLTRTIDGHQHVFVSSYETANELTEADRKRIEDVVSQMPNFPQVSPVEF